ncbi:MAG: hypothetical protein IH891_11235 [Planctomycetes bacterium]|nr:hypothetical protein [Planctomycetota bacterium]
MNSNRPSNAAPRYSSSAWAALARSVALGTLAAVGASLLAAPLAFFTGRAHFRGRHVLSAAALIPLALPPYNVALALRAWLPAEPLVAVLQRLEGLIGGGHRFFQRVIGLKPKNRNTKG